MKSTQNFGMKYPRQRRGPETARKTRSIVARGREGERQRESERDVLCFIKSALGSLRARWVVFYGLGFRL